VGGEREDDSEGGVLGLMAGLGYGKRTGGWVLCEG